MYRTKKQEWSKVLHNHFTTGLPKTTKFLRHHWRECLSLAWLPNTQMLCVFGRDVSLMRPVDGLAVEAIEEIFFLSLVAGGPGVSGNTTQVHLDAPT